VNKQKLKQPKSKIITGSKTNTVRQNIAEILQARADGYTWASIATSLRPDLDKRSLQVFVKRLAAGVTVTPPVTQTVTSTNIRETEAASSIPHCVASTSARRQSRLSDATTGQKRAVGKRMVDIQTKVSRGVR
jgi:hypothetical protein